MPSKSNKNQGVRQPRRTQLNHSFRGLRDPLVYGTTGGVPNTANRTVGVDANGNFNYQVPLAPLGLTAATLASGTYSAGASGNACAPVLRGLYNKCADFQWYRVTRAKLVFVGSAGSTATGVITLAGYSDPSDVAAGTYMANVSSTNTKAFDVASSATRELSVPIPVDSAWKKVTSLLSVPGGVVPYSGSGSSPAVLVSINTVSDLCFGAISVTVAGAAASATLGYMYIDYDVEFKGPIDTAVQA